MRLDGEQLAGFDQRGDDAPVDAALIGAGAIMTRALGLWSGELRD